MLSVSDTGVGMTEEVKARLLKRFLPRNQKARARDWDWQPARPSPCNPAGTSKFPASWAGARHSKYISRKCNSRWTPPPRSAQTRELPRGTETLLLVEDEPSVRHLACSILEGRGYNVLRANNGQEGLQVANNLKGQALHLVITDVIMPQMSGKVMAEWLKAADPNIKILFTSVTRMTPLPIMACWKRASHFFPNLTLRRHLPAKSGSCWMRKRTSRRAAHENQSQDFLDLIQHVLAGGVRGVCWR